MYAKITAFKQSRIDSKYYNVISSSWQHRNITSYFGNIFYLVYKKLLITVLGLTHSLPKDKGLGLLQDRGNDCDYVVRA